MSIYILRGHTMTPFLAEKYCNRRKTRETRVNAKKSNNDKAPSVFRLYILSAGSTCARGPSRGSNLDTEMLAVHGRASTRYILECYDRSCFHTELPKQSAYSPGRAGGK